MNLESPKKKRKYTEDLTKEDEAKKEAERRSR